MTHAMNLLKHITEDLDPKSFTVEEVKDELGAHAEYYKNPHGEGMIHEPDKVPMRLQMLIKEKYVEKNNDGSYSVTEKGMKAGEEETNE